MIDIATHYIHGYTSKCLGKAKEVDISIYVATCCILLAEQDTELNPLQLRKASEEEQPAAATGCCTLNLTHLCEASLQKSETNTSALAGLTHTCRGLANFNYPELVRLSIAYFPQATLPNFATTANIVSCHFQANTAPYN